MTLKLILCAGASVLALAACNDDDDGTPPGGGGQGALEDQFGPGFGALYRASANSDPADPAANAVNAVDPARDPVPVP